jgi:hypothetical protein
MGRVPTPFRDRNGAQTVGRTLQARVTKVLHGVPKRATYEEILEVLEDRFRVHHLAAAYRSRLKLMTQGVSESLQEFVAAVGQLDTVLNLHYRRTM